MGKAMNKKELEKGLECKFCSDGKLHQVLARHLLNCEKLDGNKDRAYSRCQFCDYSTKDSNYFDHLRTCGSFQNKLQGFVKTAEKGVDKIKRSPLLNSPQDNVGLIKTEVIQGKKYFVFRCPADMYPCYDTPVQSVSDSFSPWSQATESFYSPQPNTMQHSFGQLDLADNSPAETFCSPQLGSVQYKLDQPVKLAETAAFLKETRTSDSAFREMTRSDSLLDSNYINPEVIFQ
ncbi:hypothetical protein HDV01_002614 [Terramyces sp. JEL0728]|nr:hypothetical protein HDV01_002614 [Terramyces sp. JEL0728]